MTRPPLTVSLLSTGATSSEAEGNDARLHNHEPRFSHLSDAPINSSDWSFSFHSQPLFNDFLSLFAGLMLPHSYDALTLKLLKAKFEVQNNSKTE